MYWRPTGKDHLSASFDRIREAGDLLRAQEWCLMMYVSGVAAECMLRALRRQDAPFDEGHDLASLLKACNVPQKSYNRLREPIQTIRQSWANGMRYAHRDMFLGFLKERGLTRGLRRGSDPLKFRAIELYRACCEVIVIGKQSWRG